jgi:hypothetical protein
LAASEQDLPIGILFAPFLTFSSNTSVRSDSFGGQSMNRQPYRIRLVRFAVAAAVGAAIFVPTVATYAQANNAELAARRQAVLQQDTFLTDDGEIVDQDAIVLPQTNAVPVRTMTYRAENTERVPVEQVRWGRRYYRNYGGYYAPRTYAPRYYSGYGSYYAPYGGYLRAYGPGYYPGRYYGPGYGRYYGGGIRFGRAGVYWRY